MVRSPGLKPGYSASKAEGLFIGRRAERLELRAGRAPALFLFTKQAPRYLGIRSMKWSQPRGLNPLISCLKNRPLDSSCWLRKARIRPDSNRREQFCRLRANASCLRIQNRRVRVSSSTHFWAHLFSRQSRGPPRSNSPNCLVCTELPFR